jgi:hypothetical protein
VKFREAYEPRTVAGYPADGRYHRCLRPCTSFAINLDRNI